MAIEDAIIDFFGGLLTGGANLLIALALIVVVGGILIILFLRVKNKDLPRLLGSVLLVAVFVIFILPSAISLIEDISDGTFGQDKFYVDATITVSAPLLPGPPLVDLEVSNPIQQGPFPQSSIQSQALCIVGICGGDQVNLIITGETSQTVSYGPFEIDPIFNPEPFVQTRRIYNLVEGDYTFTAQAIEFDGGIGQDVINIQVS